MADETLAVAEGNDPREALVARPRRGSRLPKGSLIVLPTDTGAFPRDGVRVMTITFAGTSRLAITAKDLRKVETALGYRLDTVRTTVPGILDSVRDTAARKRGRKAAAVAQTNSLRDTYMRLCGAGRRDQQIAAAASTVAAADAALVRVQRELVARLREWETAERHLRQVTAISEDLSHLGTEFDQLIKHPDIDHLDITATRLYVTTKLIQIEYNKVTYNIGKFEIQINDDGVVKMFNKTRGGQRDNINAGRNGCHHPHVNADGFPCLGNIKLVLPRIIAERKYAAAAAICIQYLKSYENSTEYGPYVLIEAWGDKAKEIANE